MLTLIASHESALKPSMRRGINFLEMISVSNVAILYRARTLSEPQKIALNATQVHTISLFYFPVYVIQGMFTIYRAAPLLPRARPSNHFFRLAKMNLMTISQSLDEAYNKHKIIPEVIDKFDTHGLLTIEYSQHHHVTMGNTLKVKDAQTTPTVQFTLNSPNQQQEMNVDEEDRFTLILTDPDAPSNKDHKWSEYCHWIVTDLALNANNSGSHDQLSTLIDLSKGHEIVPYMGPGPPPKTKKHRYVFLLYKQDPKAHLVAPPDRPNWGTGVPGSGVRDWIKKHGGHSKLLGVNFFYAQNDIQE